MIKKVMLVFFFSFPIFAHEPDTSTAEITYIAIDVNHINAVLHYLRDQPYKDAIKLIDGLLTGKIIQVEAPPASDKEK